MPRRPANATLETQPETAASTRGVPAAGASWLDGWTGKPVAESGWVTAAAPLERIPVYLREGGSLSLLSPGGLG